MEIFLESVFRRQPKKRKEFEEKGQLDLSYALPQVFRFRVNVYKQRGTYTMAFRVIPFEIPLFKELNLPPVMPQIA